MKEFKIGDKVRIKDAMDISYIGKIGIIEEISSHEPFSVKLNIDGKEGSWACAWLFSQIELISNYGGVYYERRIKIFQRRISKNSR